MKIRIFFALLICKLLRFLARALKRGGTAVPGRVALLICPQLLSVLADGVKTILVTGSNGKSTCVKMIENALRQEGIATISNGSGANLIGGILADFAEKCDLFGNVRAAWAVIECDEGSAEQVFPQLRPEVILLTNLFPDQLDRFGNPDQVGEILKRAIHAVPKARLCLNADCRLSTALAQGVHNPRCFFAMEQTMTGEEKRRKEEKNDYAVTEIVEQNRDSSTVVMRFRGKKELVRINLPAEYNIVNGLAAAACICEAGFSQERAVQALADFSHSFGRMERFPLGKGAQMILVKNAPGCNQVLRYLQELRQPYTLVLSQNDQAGDGTDISWLWDVEYERLCLGTGRLRKIYLSGERAEELQLRLKYAGMDSQSLLLEKNPERLVAQLKQEPCQIYILPSYSAMLTLRRAIVVCCGGTAFWE